jgi:hypothetical protein
MVAAQAVDSRPARFMTWFALIIAIATAAAYSFLVRAQGGYTGLDVLTVPFVTGYMVLMAALLAGSLVRGVQAGPRMTMRAAAAAGLLVLGILALFSVGLPLVVAGATATGATVRTLRGPHLTSASLIAVGVAVLSVALLVGGFEVTERFIACPAHGTSAGGGTGLVTGPYHYECVDGRLSFQMGA